MDTVNLKAKALAEALYMDSKAVAARVMDDLAERYQAGLAEYGRPLTPFNGRDALQDAYEEALDMALYLKQTLMEEQQRFPFFHQLEDKVINWAYDRNIILEATPIAQASKTVEEVAELIAALETEDDQAVKDAIGDILVTLIIITHMWFGEAVNLTDCIKTAWEEIKDRKGRMVNGVFVKEEDA